LLVGAHKNFKHQKTNPKRFDKLTALSLVEGQISMTKIQNSKHSPPALVPDDIFIGGPNLLQRYLAMAVNVLVIEY